MIAGLSLLLGIVLVASFAPWWLAILIAAGVAAIWQRG